ncbi:hypothetical protein PRZ48_011589 [Zasmidium cellare]|uniref:Uncharacterized protein n=1 Tax=Zasmidium cellare TaxID=395010 RepID=A0ABR0E6V0_ZASCE|nr:hypothetical protein PRZ48_011589 [Zasmidium cellare]
MEDMPDDFTPVVFIAIMRLVRHARQVWPQAMRTLAEMMLQHLQSRQLKEGAFRNSELAKITHLLNKLMSVISLSTAEHPFKNNSYQESAIVPILQYMADYRPALHINRQGYRAVIRIQLRQRKNSQEGQWAELKALSWPPWKVDRNAMDTELGPEHGISRAGATLARMHEAGYRPLYWEKLAKLFTGWDIDQTPTIQMRALLSHPGMMLSNKINVNNEPWAARILSTRTIQEAWACYLAWEDAKLPPDQNVYLATFFKLREEQRRQQMRAAVGKDELAGEARYWPLLPGDTREMWPLPPSTHLETYTRTDPPTVDEFYRTLLGNGVVLKDRCLAFIVVEYNTRLREGLERLQASCSVYPEIQSLISLSPTNDVLKVPSAIYAAAVRLYSRSTLSRLESCGQSTDAPDVQLPQIPGYRFNHKHPLVHALKLLHVRPAADSRLWSDVVDEMTRSNHNKLLGMSNALIRDDPTSSHHFEGPRESSEVLNRHRGAMNALRLVRHVTHLRQEQHIDIDIQGFNAVCRTVERAAGVWWRLLQSAASPELSPDESSRSLHHEAQNLARESGEYCEWLKRQFATWVGEEEQSLSTRKTQAHEDVDNVDETNEETTDPREDMPKLLTVPDSATLHAYIRALGWLGDFKGLHATVEWMHKYRSELLERAERDRRGEEMTRKALIALRVFLERSWIRDPIPALDPDDAGQFEHAEHPTEAARLLARARNPADADTIAAVREIVEDVEQWGGWPSDEEVRSYINNLSFYEAGEWRWTKWTAPNSGQSDVEGGASKSKIHPSDQEKEKMGNTLTTSTPSFLLQHQHQSSQPQPQKPLKDRPSSSVKEPAFQGYVAGWRQSSFDSDAQEFSFATFQTSHVSRSNETGEGEGYEGDDEDSQHQDQNLRVQKSEFESLDRGRGLGRNGSLREREKVDGGEGDARTWKERKFEEREPSLERKLERVRWVVGEEHALPRIGRGEGVVRG